MATTPDEPLRDDEVWFRLREWTNEQAPSERLAAQVLHHEGFKGIDPSHPLGGKDDGRDGECTRNGEKWTWAVYFPRGEHGLKEIKAKLVDDVAAARKHEPKGIAFVTNQELRLAERKQLKDLGGDIEIDLYHLERVASILERPQMASVRRQYLKIATARPDMSVTAEVIGSARMFTRDEELLDWYVGEYAKDVREQSDKAWAKVRAEEEANARAEARGKAAKLRHEADKARSAAHQAAEDALAKDKPIGLTEIAMASMPTFKDIVPKFNFDDFMPKYNFEDVRPKYDLGMDPSFARQLAGGFAEAEPVPPPSKPLSDEEIEEKLANFRAELEARWESCKDYLAGVAWPGLRFRILNAKGFLTRVKVELTFRGARGLAHEYIESFEWFKLQDPSWEEPIDPSSWRIPMAAPPLMPRDLATYPVKWEHNDNGDLVVKISLPELPPDEVWSSDDDDLVLMMRDEKLDSVRVTYTVAAYEYDDRQVGEPITVPVEQVEIFDSVHDALEASRQAE